MADLRFEEYFVLRVTESSESPGGRLRLVQERYLDRRGGLGPLSRARRYRTVEEAQAATGERAATPGARLVVQRCTRERPRRQGEAGPGPLDLLMSIPQPYRRTAYNWLCGRDVEGLLRRQSDEVYDRHRRMLLDHGVDISQPSTVRLFRRPRRPIPINTGTPPADGGPRRYITPRAERPSLPRTEGGD